MSPSAARAAAAASLARPVTNAFAADVCARLTTLPKTLPSKYLYDALGSALFEAICRLPWYEVTRAEQRLLEAHAATVRRLADPALIVELGPGSGDKLATLVRPSPIAGTPSSVQTHAPLHVHLIDISPAALDQASRTLAQVPGIRVTTTPASYEEGLRELARVRPRPASTWPSSHSHGPALKSAPSAIAASPSGRAMVLFLGSNIGNFDPPQSHALLSAIRAALRAGDTLLLGLDLVKPEPVLQLAYDDPLGVTAAFNLNLLTRMNVELGADFDLARFAHRVVWNAEHSRIEMHVASRGAQTVRIPGASCTVAFEDDETIWTESSYKYDLADAERLGRNAGFRVRDQWVDDPGRFALTLFEA